MNSGSLEIDTLRIRGAKAQQPTVNLRLAHQLNTAELHPTGFSPSAILLVRRISDPLPGQIVSTRPVLRVDAAWETAVRRSLEKSYRQAARPRQGLILGEPEALVFADEAEMLACLLLAQQRSLSSATWWFRTLLNHLSPAKTVVGRLVERPDLIPAVFGYLADWNGAEDVLLKISSQQSYDLLKAVIKQFQLLTLLPPERVISRTASSKEYSHPPWVSLSSSDFPTHLDPEQQALLGLCLLLQIHPAVVRNPAFQMEWQQWWQTVDDYSLASTALSGMFSSTNVDSNQIDKNSDPISSQIDEIPSITTESHKSGEISLAEHRVDEAADVVKAIRPVNSEKVLSPNASTSNAEMSVPHSAINPWPSEAKTSPPSSQIDIVLQQPDPFASPGSWVETAVGGVLYLINLMQMLDLPVACEPGWGLASQVSSWGVLELLGRALLGSAGADYAADPLWRVLADLDGRRGETPPGENYEMVGDGSFSAGWTAVTDHSWSPGDLPLLCGISPDLQRWLELVLPYITRRLRHALHLQDTDDMASILLLAAGRLFVTRSHVDLVMDLNAISLPVRRAGMDANPGWLPAFGRVVTFHFL